MAEQEILKSLEGQADTVVFYYDKNKQLVGYRYRHIKEYQRTTHVSLVTGDTVDCFHGQARSQLYDKMASEKVVKKYATFTRRHAGGFYQSDKGAWR